MKMPLHQKTDSKRLDSLKTMLVLTEASYAYVNRVNDYFREHGTVQGYPHMERSVAKLIDDGIKNREGEFSDGLPFSNHSVMHDYYEIQRLKQEIAELESHMDKFVGWTFPGGEAIINTEHNRLQLKFDGTVGLVKQAVLKWHGFTWEPCDGVWERRLDREAIHAADQIRFIRPADGTSPEKLQPY